MSSLNTDLLKQFCQKYINSNIETLRNQENSRKPQTTQDDNETTSNLYPSESKKLSNLLPICINGKVIRGFGRGSKELGIPTANYDEDIVENLPEDFEVGSIYFCWAQVVYKNLDGSDVSPQGKDNNDMHSQIHPAVMSIGWNPYYKNDKKSMETHVINDFGHEWYDCQLRTMIVGRLRGEKNFNSLEALIEAINKDISDAKGLLTSEWSMACRAEDFFV